jgi:hypothetical protein
MTRLLLVLAASLLAVPVALADGPMPSVTQNGDGVPTADGRSRYVAVGAFGGSTVLAQIGAKGAVLRTLQLDGDWGLPIATYGTSAEGLSHDDRTLVLRRFDRSTFALVDARTLRLRATVPLRGDFAYDALSPDARRLYLIQHVDATNLNRYVVRAFDTGTLRLLPGRIADRTQKGWVMEGTPMSRATSADGRWVYTLYGNNANFAFVHALDTVRGVAHCVGLPVRNVDALLSLHGSTLYAGKWRIDTATWRVSRHTAGGVPWWWLVAGVGLLLGGGAAAWLRRRRVPAADAAGGAVLAAGAAAVARRHRPGLSAGHDVPRGLGPARRRRVRGVGGRPTARRRLVPALHRRGAR